MVPHVLNNIEARCADNIPFSAPLALFTLRKIACVYRCYLSLFSREEQVRYGFRGEHLAQRGYIAPRLARRGQLSLPMFASACARGDWSATCSTHTYLYIYLNRS